MEAEFEEKEYESPLIHQLMMESNNMWSPGQVFEGNFGIDTSLEVLRPDFWKTIGHFDYPNSVILSDYNFGYVWRKIKRKRKLPDFSLNLFLQIKRPEGLKNRPRNLKALGLRSPYWRFGIKKHQQELLMQLARKLNNRAFVAYASPAFHLANDLYTNTRNNTLVENSTFVRAERLNGHYKWVYDCSGSNGIACSKPQRIEDEYFFNEINNAIKKNNNEKNNENENLIQLEQSIIEISSKSRKSNYIANEILFRYESIVEMEISKESKSYILIKIFANLTNSNWITLG
ncbi:hypothetical protein [Psychroserpens jangbogonensis]|uniref:hypothetical protein n=1 Tax=Psychroserpens jangbogonensis TaxID=1484460 RepID=UPI00053D0539|nr:hypothetical protein [Psychroserpens jangbogonensis]